MPSRIAAAIDYGNSRCICDAVAPVDDAHMQSIGSRVTALRAARLMSQQALADEIGVAQPTIANIERGRTKQIKGYVLERLAHALNTTTRFILEGDDQGDAEEAAVQAELLGIWNKLPQAHRETLLQTARGLLRAAEIAPPTAPAPARKPAKALPNKVA